MDNQYPRGTSGVVVTPSSSNSAVATVPASLAIPGGQSTAQFALDSQQGTTPETVTISAFLTGGTMTTELTVSPSVLDDLAILPSFVTAGQTCTGFVGLSGTAPPGGAIVRLSSRNT